MPARVVVVHDDGPHLKPIAASLRSAGFDVAAYADPLAAMTALEDAQRLEVLLTRIHFAPGKSNGVALARMARTKRPGTKVIFLEQADDPALTEGLGQALEMAVDAPEIVRLVANLLDTRD